jgi:CRISPR/Cas system-associated exonuclease Cas4 (RecB family)
VDLGVDEEHLIDMFKTVEAAIFDPVPGPMCHHCDFRRFCPAGQAYVAHHPRDN